MNFLHVLEEQPVDNYTGLQIPIWGEEYKLPSNFECIYRNYRVTGSWLHRLLCYFGIRSPTSYTIDVLYCWEDKQ